MFRFMQRFVRDSQTKWRGTGPLNRVRRRNHRLNCEALEGRQLLSGYYLVNAASGKVLDDPNFSTTNGAAIDQWQLNGGANQQWNLVAGKYGIEVKNAFSGKLLDDPGSSKSSGTPIIQDTANGGANQQWNFVKLPNGNDEVFNESTGQVLDDPGSSLKNGTQIIQYTKNGGLNQQWVLLAAGNAPAVTDYVVNASSGKVLDDPDSSASNGTQIQQYQLDLGSNQQWVFIPLANGKDLIVNASSGKVLDDPNSSISNGTTLIQYQLDGGTNQQWNLVAQTDGNWELKNASSGKVLADPNSSTSNGTAIRQYEPTGGTNQQWTISPFANPVALTAYSPAPAGIPLFRSGGPFYRDVAQGTDPSTVGDCWLEASLAEVAARDPQAIRNMFTYDGTTVDNGATVGLYTVRFFNTSGSAVYVKVDTELPSGGNYYDHVRNALGTQVLWVALAEKAYAVANGLGYVTTANEYQDSYSALYGGWPSWALPAITGKPAANYNINSTNLASDWKAGDLIVLVTSSPRSSYLFPNHCYAVVGYNAASSNPFELFNPWGADSSGWCPGESNKIYGLFWVNSTFISQNFIKQSIGSG